MQRSFEWFVNLLSQLEIEQAEMGGAMERFLDMHMYITSALQKTDMKAVGLQLALDLLHKKVHKETLGYDIVNTVQEEAVTIRFHACMNAQCAETISHNLGIVLNHFYYSHILYFCHSLSATSSPA